MKDEVEEPAERLLGDFINLEIDLAADPNLSESEQGTRRRRQRSYPRKHYAP